MAKGPAASPSVATVALRSAGRNRETGSGKNRAGGLPPSPAMPTGQIDPQPGPLRQGGSHGGRDKRPIRRRAGPAAMPSMAGCAVCSGHARRGVPMQTSALSLRATARRLPRRLDVRRERAIRPILACARRFCAVFVERSWPLHELQRAMNGRNCQAGLDFER